MNIFKKVASKVKDTYRTHVGYRKLYSEDMLATYSKEQKVALRSKYLIQLGYFSLLLLLSFLTLFGLLSISRPSGTGNENYSIYRSEQDVLSSRLDSIYGKGNWEFGIYQTTLDAYRVVVTLSNGETVEHYYRVENGNIYRLELE